MRGTIDELSARVVELKAENQRLETALREALSASRSGKRIATGCNIEAAKDSFLYETSPVAKGRNLMYWMKQHGKQCNAPQLKQLRAYALVIPLDFGEPVVTLIDDLSRSI